jgi:hypothetical protein
MKYYKYLDLDHTEISDKIKNYFLTKNPEFISDNGQGSWRLAPINIHDEIPELTEFFKILNLTIEFVGFFVSFKNESSIHIDNDNKPCRINFPILNCEDTETLYYKIKKIDYINETQKNNLTYKLLKKENCEIVDKFVLNKPVLMRVLEPHQVVVNSNNFPRVSCTVQFTEDISHLLE